MPNPYDQYKVGGGYDDLDSLFGSSTPAPQRRSHTIAPLRVRQPKPVEPTPPPVEEPGWFQKYGPMVARGIGGYAGFTPWTGAIGGGVGEAVAEGIEQQDWTPDLDPKRIIAETAIGAAGGGFAKLLGAGITSIPRAIAAGSALGGAAPVIRHGVEEGNWDPTTYGKELALGVGLGGATAGGLTAILNKFHPKAPGGSGTRYDVESTALPGGRVLGTGKQGTQYVNPIRPIHGEGPTLNIEPRPSHTPEDFGVDTAYLAGPEPMSTTAARTADKEAREAQRASEVLKKQRLEEDKLKELKTLFGANGEREVVTSESLSAVDPKTGHRLGAKWVTPAEDGVDNAGGVLASQADEPADLASEIARIKAELAQTPAEPPQSGLSIRGLGDAPIPAEAPVSAPPVEAPAVSPLEELLSPQNPGKTPVSDPMAAISEQAQGQSLAELMSQVDPNRPQTRMYTPEGSVSAPPGADPAEAMAALQGEAPLAAPELPEAGTPATLFKGSRADVSGDHYRELQDLFKKGEVPKDAARLAGAGLRGEAKRAGLPTGKAVNAPEAVPTVPETMAAPEAPVAPTSGQWSDDESAMVDQLMQLPKEERLAAFLKMNEGDAVPPAFVEQAKPTAPETPPPTAEQVSELQKLLLQSGAIKDINEVPAWLKSQIGQAPEAPVVPPTSTLKSKADIGGPRLNKDKGYAPQNYRPPYTGPKDPERGAASNAFAIRMGLGAAGALVGGATDPLDDPLLSAMAGGAVGFSIPTMAQGLMKLGAAPEVVQNAMGELNLPDGVKRAAEKISRVLPQWQRANYLADVFGLGANAWAGPYGSGIFGALEKGLTGDARGWAVLNELKNPLNFFKEYGSAYHEARSLVGRAEGFSEAEATTKFEKALTTPGTILTAGDVAIRRILERHGFTDDEARIMTMTAEPFTKSGESFAHLRGLIPDMTFPFKRTPINIAEQGALRTPGLGFLMQGIGAARGTRAADSMGLQLAQQGMGAGIGFGAEQLGEQLPPEDAKVLRRFVTNAAGPYSLLAGMGMAAGQARRAGQPVAKTTLMRTADQLPLPSIEPLRDLAMFLIGEGKEVPRGLYPAGLKGNYDIAKDYLTPKPAQFPRRKKR